MLENGKLGMDMEMGLELYQRRNTARHTARRKRRWSSISGEHGDGGEPTDITTDTNPNTHRYHS